VNRMLSSWQRSMRIGMMEDPALVLRVPAWFKKIPVDNARQGVVTYEQYRKLLEALPDHLKPLLAIGYYLGMRSGEIRGLRWDQVDLDAGLIRLEAAQTKAKFAREAPIYDRELRGILDMAYDRRDPGCPYVVQYMGHRITSCVWPSWKRARELAGVPDALIHDLRRTAATNMRRARISEATVMKIVGWKSYAMFLRYNIVGSEDIQEAGRTMEVWMDRERAKVDGTPKGRTM
jgi:integrase